MSGIAESINFWMVSWCSRRELVKDSTAGNYHRSMPIHTDNSAFVLICARLLTI